MSILTLHIGNNSQIIELSYLQDHNSVDITDASIQYEVLDLSGNIILNGSLTYAVGSASKYQAVISGNLLTANTDYDIRVYGSGGGFDMDLTHRVTAQQRTT